jgi:hypothetical protein
LYSIENGVQKATIKNSHSIETKHMMMNKNDSGTAIKR